ncbi:hypothetical protein LMG27198_08400 [Methylocystis echinoides]|uniref:Uncharacterized protein n=1 Tax=Methylocystis echinoides TaxID=29468 RepID=A0A9W6GRZ3_9HYPH|nr:hypothetical protein LMG27198_08400 [Methylocystis echinoides]
MPYEPEQFNGLLTVRRVPDLLITDCVFDGAPEAAVALWECDDAKIMSNRISNSRVAFYSYAGRGIMFFENVLEEPVEFGVYSHFA